MEKILPIGTKVRVIKGAANASHFRKNNPNIPFNGIYSIHNWENTIFVISGPPKKCEFSMFPEIFGAYPLTFNKKLVGYVYNDALKVVDLASESSSTTINITINITIK